MTIRLTYKKTMELEAFTKRMRFIIPFKTVQKIEEKQDYYNVYIEGGHQPESTIFQLGICEASHIVGKQDERLIYPVEITILTTLNLIEN